MRSIRLTSLLLASTLAVASTSTVLSTSAFAKTASKPSCGNLTKSLVVKDGYTKATGPKITKYNYAHPDKNEANALGTTYDFGSKALVVGCVSPTDLVQLSIAAQGKKKPTMTATQYLAYMVKQSAGAMTKTPVAGMDDYLDFGNGKEDGVGSMDKARSLRLDAWVIGNYIVLTFSGPVTSQKAPAALVNFINSTKTAL